MSTTPRLEFPDRWVRLSGAAGLVFVALTVAGGFVQGDVPVYSEGPTPIREWFADNSDRYLAGGLLIVLGAFFYLGFLAGLVSLLRRAEGEDHLWSWLALLSGIHLLVAVQVSAAFDPTLALLEGDISDDVARALSAADYMTFLFVYPFAGALALAVAVVILRTRVLWVPLAWVAPLITITGFIGIAAPLQHDAEGSLTTVGYVALLLFLAWAAGVSVAMIRSAKVS